MKKRIAGVISPLLSSACITAPMAIDTQTIQRDF